MNIELDKIKEEDIELLRKWRMSPEVTRYMLTNPVITEEQQKKWYKTISNNKEEYYWIIKCDDVRIGYLNITHIDKGRGTCEIGHYIGEQAYLGKGIAKAVEANIYDFIFDTLQLKTVIFTLLKDNVAAYGLHLSLGAVKYEIEEKYCNKNNTCFELVALCMTRDIWKKQKVDRVYPRVIIN